MNNWIKIGFVISAVFIAYKIKHPNPKGNKDSFSELPVSVVIGKKEERGYPFVYTTNVGRKYLLFFSDNDAEIAIEQAKRDGIDIEDLRNTNVKVYTEDM